MKPRKRGNRYALVPIKPSAQATEVVRISDKSTKFAASAIIRDLFCKHGIPKSLLTDRGCESDNLSLRTMHAHARHRQEAHLSITSPSQWNC